MVSSQYSLKKSPAGVRVDRAVVAEKKGFAHLVFESLDGPGQARRGDVALHAGTTEMKRRRQMFKQFQFPDIHERKVKKRGGPGLPAGRPGRALAGKGGAGVPVASNVAISAIQYHE